MEEKNKKLKEDKSSSHPSSSNEASEKEECPLCNVSEETLEKLRGKRQLEETTVKEKPKKRFWRRLLKGKS